MKFTQDASGRPNAELKVGDYWYGIPSSERADWGLVPEILHEIFPNSAQCESFIYAVNNRQDSDADTVVWEDDSNDFYVSASLSSVEMEHATFDDSRNLQLEVFVSVVNEWKKHIRACESG